MKEDGYTGDLRLTIENDRNELEIVELAAVGEVEIGRQRQEDPPPCETLRDGSRARVIIAPLEATEVSRQLATIRHLGRRVQITNTSNVSLLHIGDNQPLGPQETCQVMLPSSLSLGAYKVGLGSPSRMVKMAMPVAPPGGSIEAPTRLPGLTDDAEDQCNSDRLISWLKSALGVFHHAASGPTFLLRAVKATASIVDLDVAAVFLRSGDDWHREVAHAPSPAFDLDEWTPSRKMLGSVRQEKSTFYYHTDSNRSSFDGAPTQIDVKAIVAAPILDTGGEVIGILYGEKRKSARPAAFENHVDISEVESMLVELLASGVAAGMARLEQERAAVAARVKFEQFFTPELAAQLEADPTLLQGRDMEVSVLFCDIRSFSTIAERIGANRTLDWTYEVMSTLSECVMEQEGVLVDYQGDQVMAMWGAPVAQPDHAARACRAAVNMLRALPAVSRKWQDQIGCETLVGIGINSGIAHVGNTGSQQKFKYGPLGNTVNLASRLQGATRYLRVDLLIGETTSSSLPADVPRRQLCQVRVNNIKEPVTLYELPAEADSSWQDLAARYQEAIQLSYQGEFHAAVKLLGQILELYPSDHPTLQLLTRVVAAMKSPDTNFDPIWELAGK